MHNNDLILVQVYVDDIIFGSTNDNLCKRFAKLIVRSVVFVEGGLNTNCTGLSKFVWLVLIFKYETNLWRKYKRNKI